MTLNHGTLHAYKNGRCRCPRCRQAMSHHRRRERARRTAECQLIDGRWTNPHANHGTTSAYTNHCCRCHACTEAWRTTYADYRKKATA